MIITIICTLLLLYAISQYNKGKYACPFYIFVFFVSDAFILNLGEPLLKYKDFSLLLLFSCSLIGLIRDSSFFKIKGTLGGKISVAFLFLFIFEFLYGCFAGVDTLSNIMAVVRGYLFVLAYFVFRKAPMDEINKSIRWIYMSVILSCMVFVVQYLTHIPLTRTFITESNIKTGNYRMQITPPFIELSLLSLLFYLRKIRYRWVVVVLILGVLFISQNRTPLLGLFLSTGLFLLLDRKVKYKVQIMIAAICIFPFVNSLLSSRSEASHETSSFDVPVWNYISQGDFQGLAVQNTFMFRVAMIAERADYLINNPANMLQGVGPMHEYTAQKKLHFIIGTATSDGRGYLVPSQVESIDVAWVPILIRYGLGGLAIHLTVILVMIVKFYRRRSNATIMLGFLTYITALAQSFSSGGMFFPLSIMTMMCFLIAYDRRIDLLYGNAITYKKK